MSTLAIQGLATHIGTFLTKTPIQQGTTRIRTPAARFRLLAPTRTNNVANSSEQVAARREHNFWMDRWQATLPRHVHSNRVTVLMESVELCVAAWPRLFPITLLSARSRVRALAWGLYQAHMRHRLVRQWPHFRWTNPTTGKQ